VKSAECVLAVWDFVEIWLLVKHVMQSTDDSNLKYRCRLFRVVLPAREST
jgi:hypothetical protein